MQLHFALITGASLTAKGWPDLPPETWVVALVFLLAGVLLGGHLSKHISVARARRLMVAIALAGSTITIIKGIASL